MRSLHASWPRALGASLVAHGLAHAVLPLRGAGAVGPDAWSNGAATLCYGAAIVGFVAAGVGAFGVRPFHRIVWPLALVGATASLIGFWMLGDGGLWPGVLLDVALLIGAAALGPPRAPSRSLAAHAAGLALVAWVAVSAGLWPWHRYWGTTPAERAMALPGDAEGRDRAFEVMHGVDIDAPPEGVWPWLVQIGQDRAGFYSYDWLERLFLADIRNVDEVRPEWQARRAGDFVRAVQPNYLGGVLGEDLGWYVLEVQPARALVLHHWGAFVLEDNGRGGTRLYVRSTISHPAIPVWAAAVSFTTFELPHFVMQRRMLLGIKERAERAGVRG